MTKRRGGIVVIFVLCIYDVAGKSCLTEKKFVNDCTPK